MMVWVFHCDDLPLRVSHINLCDLMSQFCFNVLQAFVNINQLKFVLSCFYSKINVIHN